uniref:Soluble ligand binding domain-containing protein n=1 Tax=Eiseniibacteriota bacterium TaxID=2212470 RepID=A0A832MM39_UNCEI
MTRFWLSLLTLTLLAVGAPGARAQEADTTAMDWSAVPEYRIVPGDVLELNFGPRPEAPGQDAIRRQRVRPDGRISVFPIGDVVAAGRTPAELQATLLALLAADLRQPRVTVEVAEVAGNQVHVLGRVKKPDSYAVGPFFTLAQAIARAGGFEDDAARNSVLVFRRDGARTVRVARVALDRSLKKGSLAADLPLSRFDIVYVPRSTIGNVDVFVRQFFGETQPLLSSALVGWQLFNLDRVYVTTPITP